VPFTDIVFSSYEIKATIAALWFAVSHVYWSIEMDETADQVEAHGLVNVQQSDYQRRTMYSLYFGALFAVFIWTIGFLWYVFTLAKLPEAEWLGPSYGLVEIGILLHTWLVGRSAIKSMYRMISSFQQALAGQMRRETKAAD